MKNPMERGYFRDDEESPVIYPVISASCYSLQAIDSMKMFSIPMRNMSKFLKFAIGVPGW